MAASTAIASAEIATTARWAEDFGVAPAGVGLAAGWVPGALGGGGEAMYSSGADGDSVTPAGVVT